MSWSFALNDFEEPVAFPEGDDDCHDLEGTCWCNPVYRDELIIHCYEGFEAWILRAT